MYGMDTRASPYFPEELDTDNSVSEFILLITYYTICALLLHLFQPMNNHFVRIAEGGLNSYFSFSFLFYFSFSFLIYFLFLELELGLE